MTTLGTLLTRTRDRLDESAARHWSDARLRTWILDGLEDIAREAECLLATGTIAAVAGTQTYSCSSLTPSPLRIHRIEFQRTGDTTKYPLEYKDFMVMDDIWATSQAQSQGTPAYWTGWGFFPSLSLYLYPTPSASGTIRLFYYRLPPRLLTDGTDDTDTVDCPDGWENLAVDFAEYHALRNDRDPRWSEARAMYAERLQSMIDKTIRPSDQPGQFVTGSGLGIPHWLYAME